MTYFNQLRNRVHELEIKALNDDSFTEEYLDAYVELIEYQEQHGPWK